MKANQHSSAENVLHLALKRWKQQEFDYVNAACRSPNVSVHNKGRSYSFCICWLCSDVSGRSRVCSHDTKFPESQRIIFFFSKLQIPPTPVVLCCPNCSQQRYLKQTWPPSGRSWQSIKPVTTLLQQLNHIYRQEARGLKRTKAMQRGHTGWKLFYEIWQHFKRPGFNVLTPAQGLTAARKLEMHTHVALRQQNIGFS